MARLKPVEPKRTGEPEGKKTWPLWCCLKPDDLAKLAVYQWVNHDSNLIDTLTQEPVQPVQVDAEDIEEEHIEATGREISHAPHGSKYHEVK